MNRVSISMSNIAPLSVFRILFGLLMLFSTIRFWAKGWIKELYIDPGFHFKYYGFEWVPELTSWGIYLVFTVMGISALCIALGFLYRICSITFFLSFTYIELLDVANYLNHYYFVSLMAFIMIFLPAHRNSSLDVRFGLTTTIDKVNHWYVNIIRFQLAIVYFYAGVAKLNPDWLFEALPLSMWLPARADMPLLGWIMDYKFTAYFFSWFGALYDLSIPFFLWNKKTRPYAFAAVVAFHLLTWALFPIGVFPWVMIFSTLIFFSDSFHQKILDKLQFLFAPKKVKESAAPKLMSPVLKYTVYLFLAVQMILPWRFLAYPGNLFWTEQGYRFSWRVMLMEKAGYISYRIIDPETGNQAEISVGDFLTPNQEKQLATQPDLILQFGHFLEKEYQKQGISEPQIYADAFVTLNGRGSKRFIDPGVDLSNIEDSFAHKFWILPDE